MRLLGIAAILLALVLLVLWATDRLPGTLNARQTIHTIEAAGANHAGFRRAHSRGVCVEGWFDPSDALRQYSRAAMFQQPRIPVIGRLSVGGNTPEANEATARVRSLALLFTGEDGQQWRLAMNSFPFFSLPSAEAFLEQTRAQIPDPTTGKPDPAALAQIQQRYPSARAFAHWAANAPWTDSWATTAYNGIHTFHFIGADGTDTPLRWSLVPQATATELPEAFRSQAGADYLEREFAQRLKRGPAAWTLELQLAAPGDDLADPSTPWPEARTRIDAGTLWLNAMSAQQGGLCDGINFDPTVVPDGIRLSSDPILAFRSAAYAQSWNRRLQEHRQHAAQEATR